MNKATVHPHLLPPSVVQTIPEDSPSPTNTTDYSSEWYAKYSSTPYNTSIFFKGPLLYNSILADAGVNISTSELITFKTNVKTHLLQEHIHDKAVEWSTTTFKLFELHGVRHSERIKSQNRNINYSEL